MKIGPALGIGLSATLFEEFGWRGFLLSLLVSPLVFGGVLNLIGVVGFVLTVAGGCLGGMLDSRRR